MVKQYIVTNFAYGTGPYLRTTDLAIAFNDEFEKAGRKRLGVIIPWVYGEKQKKIMLEEFAEHEKKYPGELLLDAELGALLKSIFYGGNTYEEALEKWIQSAEDVSASAHAHLSCDDFKVETLSGGKQTINGKDIVVELNRSPRIRYDVAPSYFSSFAYIAEILERAIIEEKIAVKKDLLKEGIEVADRVEKNQKIHCIAHPATFSYIKNNKPRYHREHRVPPITPLLYENNESIEPGGFVTVTGIPGREGLYKDAWRFGIKLYSNDPDAVPGSVRALPHIIPNKNILFQFARSGWGSVWISMISGTPIVVPDFDSHDDPEIYFNNRCIENLGIGIVYRGQPLKEILEHADAVREASAKMRDEILRRWGTLDGNQYCAQLFVKDFLKRG